MALSFFTPSMYKNFVLKLSSKSDQFEEIIFLLEIFFEILSEISFLIKYFERTRGKNGGLFLLMANTMYIFFLNLFCLKNSKIYVLFAILKFIFNKKWLQIAHCLATGWLFYRVFVN